MTAPRLPSLCELAPDELRATCDPYCAACGPDHRAAADPARMRARHISLILEEDEPYVWDDPLELELEILHDRIINQ